MNNEEFAVSLYNIANRELGYQDYAIISSVKLREAARRIRKLTEEYRKLAYDVLDKTKITEDYKAEVRERLKEITT